LRTAQRVGHPSLFRLADYAAGDARRRAAASFAGHSMNHNGSATVAEDGMLVGSEAYVRSHRGYVCGAIGPYDQRKIRDIASGCHSCHGVIMAAPFEVRAGSLEIRRIAFADLVNVNGMWAGRKVLDIEHDFNALWRSTQSGCADGLPLGVFEDNYNRLSRLRTAFLDHASGADKQQKCRGNAEFHLLSPCKHTNLGIVASRDDDLFYSNAENEPTGFDVAKEVAPRERTNSSVATL